MTATELIDFYPRNTWKGASEDQWSKAHEFASDSGFTRGIFNNPHIDFMFPSHSVNSTLFWPYSVPDNSVSIVRRFARNVLCFKPPMTAEAKALPEHLFRYKADDARAFDALGHLSTGTLKSVPTADAQPYAHPLFQASRAGKKVAARAYYLGSCGQDFALRQMALSQLSSVLNLSAGYPALTEREVHLRGRKADCLLIEEIAGEPLAEGLARLSGLPPGAICRPGYDVLANNPELYQKVERALLDNLVLGTRESRISISDKGAVLVRNGAFLGSDTDGKPSWKGINDRLALHFAATNLTLDSYNRLVSFYNFLGTPEGKAVLQSSRMPDHEIRNLAGRLEWLIEHRRFPGCSENNTYVY
ncbi:MAG TPA: hypothetical protein V6D17_16565 [Candidatus Obscuribacterales bacterium]